MAQIDDILNGKTQSKMVKLTQCSKRELKIYLLDLSNGSFVMNHNLWIILRLRDAKKERARSLASIHSGGRRASEEPKQGRWRKTSIHVIGAERGPENQRN